MSNKVFKTKCDFCQYWTGSSCMVSQNLNYCKDALYEYFQYKKNAGFVTKPIKSKRPWDK